VSCGKPHETDCSELLREVWLLLDHECNEERKRKLEQHLDECGPCLEQYGIEEHLKELLARKCGGDHAPDTFKRKLLAAIRERTTVVNGDGSVTETLTSVEVREERA
jgi:mycothiol system anti-sigma-R factor